MASLVLLSLGLSALLVWTGMTDRLHPSGRAARTLLAIALPFLAIVAVAFAAVWLVLGGILVFN